jgi:hypothetical protein
MITLREGYSPSSHLAYIAEHLNVDPVKDWKISWSGDEVYSITNLSIESINIIRRDSGVIEVEEGSWIFLIELDICTNPSLSEEERRICYEEKDLKDCEKPSLSEEDRPECYAFMKYLSCMRPEEITMDTDRFCSEHSRIDPCENSELSVEERRFCRDGSLFATCTNLQCSLFEEGRRTCVRKPGSGKSKASSGDL